MRTKMANKADATMPAVSHDDYEVKGHLQDLIRAHEIMADSEKMKKVHKLAGRHGKFIRSIQDIKDASNEMAMKKGDKY